MRATFKQRVSSKKREKTFYTEDPQIQALWLKLLLRKLRQEDFCKPEASLDYGVRPCQKKRKH